MLDGENGQGESLAPNADVLPAAAAPVEAPQADTPPPAPVDADAAELASAMEAVKAEEAGGQPAGEVQQEQQPSEGQPPAEAPPQAQQQAPIMVPKQRLDHEAQRRHRAEQEALYLRGQVEALQAIRQQPQDQGQQQGQPPTQQPQAQQDPAEAEVNAMQAEIDAAATRFDNGEITLKEFKAIEVPHMRRIAALEAERAAAAVAPAPQQSLADQEISRVYLARLSDAHPYVDALNEQHVVRLAERAQLDRQLEGKPPFGNDPRSVMELQAAVAKLSDEWGPKWGLPKRAPAQQQQQQQRPNPASPAGLSPQASARLQKMDLAAGHPPDTSALGTGVQDDAMSEATILNLDDEAIAALPATVRARYIGTG